MKISTAVCTAILLLVGGLTLPLHAQDPPPQGMDEGRPMQKIQQFKKMKLLERLNLDEATADKFLVKYDKWERQLMDLNHQRSILIQELRLDLEKKSGDGELNAKLDSLVDMTSKVEDTRHQMYADIRSILTAKQAAIFALFEANFQRELANTLNRMQMHHGWHDNWGQQDHDRP